MNTLEGIEAAAKDIVGICQKNQLNKDDKERLLKLQGEIFTGIENLTECELCGAITDLIATMTVNDVTAKLCKACGINALESGRIEKPKTRRRSANTTRKRTPRGKASTPQTETAEATNEKVVEKQTASKQADVTEVYAEVEKQTSIKRADVKRLHKIIQEIAGPMSLEHTILYVKTEAELAKLKIEEPALSKAVELLMAA